MSKIVSNATPLIYLSKIGRLDLLRDIFGEIIIPKEVKTEVVDRGKELKKKDAYIVESAIKDGWIKVKENKLIEVAIDVQRGERAVISLAKNLGMGDVLIDEVSARTSAKLEGLHPRGTLFVLLKALKNDLIDFDDFLECLDKLISEGFRLKEEVYVSAIREAKRIIDDKKMTYLRS